MLQRVEPLMPGQAKAIGDHCGNGWRKVFNVFSKLVFELPEYCRPDLSGYTRWQDWRDNCLLQQNSSTALLFSPPDLQRLNDIDGQPVVHIVAGRQHARTLLNEEKLTARLHWLDHEFAIDHQHHLIVCPYLDYRQLSNLKIARVAELLNGFDSSIRI